MPITAIYPGTFDPVTNGHGELIERSAALFEQVVIGVAASESKKPLFSLNERLEMLEKHTEKLPNVKIISFDGLLVEFAKQQQASVLIRGVRNTIDFEYEQQLASMNHHLSPQLETVLLMSSEKNKFISSSLIKDVALHNGDITAFVPPAVATALLARIQTRI